MSIFYDSLIKRVEAYGFYVKTGEGWAEWKSLKILEKL